MKVRRYTLSSVEKGSGTFSPHLQSPGEKEPDPIVAEEAAALPGGSSGKIYTVSELSLRIQELFEGSFPYEVSVEGELSDPKLYTSGHLWFDLKDGDASLKSVMWRDNARRLKFRPEQGLKVICAGRVEFYAPRGEVKFVVRSMEPKGVGALQLAFEQLKEKLQKEGLFAEERKRRLPVFPERVGIVTSPQGAAIDDMLKILRGEVEVLLRPTRVQGDGAAERIARGVADLNEQDGLDLLIVGRGGGSLEDLWAFNEEALARAIFLSRLPVISAVGHEKDVTISDLVADVRAPTPTRAAEIVMAQRRICLNRLAAVLEAPAFVEPEEWLAGLEEQLAELAGSLAEGAEEPILAAAQELQLLNSRLLACSPQAFIGHQAERLRHLQRTLFTGMQHALDQMHSRVDGLAGRLHALSPLAVLERGYSITFSPDGKILRNAGSVKSGDRIQTRLHRGRVTSRVESTVRHPEPRSGEGSDT